MTCAIHVFRAGWVEGLERYAQVRHVIIADFTVSFKCINLSHEWVNLPPGPLETIPKSQPAAVHTTMAVGVPSLTPMPPHLHNTGTMPAQRPVQFLRQTALAAWEAAPRWDPGRRRRGGEALMAFAHNAAMAGRCSNFDAVLGPHLSRAFSYHLSSLAHFAASRPTPINPPQTV